MVSIFHAFSENIQELPFEEKVDFFTNLAFCILNNQSGSEQSFKTLIKHLLEDEMYEAVKGIEKAIKAFNECNTTVLMRSERPINSNVFQLSFQNIEKTMVLPHDEYEITFKKSCDSFLVKSDVIFRTYEMPEIIKAAVIQLYVEEMKDGEILIWTEHPFLPEKKPAFDFTHPFMLMKDKDGKIDESLIAIKICPESRQIIHNWARESSYENMEYRLESYLWGFDCGFIPKGYFIKYTEKDVPIKHTDTLDTE